MERDIDFESHSTSTDNEQGIASGYLDPPLSEKGRKQAEELGVRYQKIKIFAVYCSDLQRSFQTAEIAFAAKQIPIIQDPRLREWDYGEYNGFPSTEIEHMKLSHLRYPFPGGESFLGAYTRICDFLQTIREPRVVIVGHRATYYTLEHLTSNISFEDLLQAPWRWQPGWRYHVSV
jgi:broad specificity phosphatase PhoE